METTLLLILAIAPPAAFMYFIYWMDRHEPESLKTILAAMVVGALSVIPALLIQLAADPIPLFQIGGLTGAFFESFLLVAPSEEFFKFIFVYLFLRNKQFYDEVNDGIVYYGAGAIGFALLENIFYVLGYGFTTGIMRAFTAIPIHTFCGVIVGYHAGLARFGDQLKPKRLIFRGLFLAYLTHAAYNTFVSAESLLAMLFVPLIIVVYFTGYKILHRGRKISIAGAQVVQGEIPHTAPVAAVPPVINYRLDEIISDLDGRKYLPPKKETWKAFISRILLAITGLLWLLAFIGDEGPPAERGELILGMILITIIPFMVGILFELSYQRRKRIRLYVD